MLALFFLFIIPIGVIAGPFDQLKNLKIDPRTIVKPGVAVPGFQFDNFTLNRESNNASRVWTVDVKISQAIASNLYVVKTIFQNREGVTLFSGEDIPLPAGSAGKTYHLTRPFPKEPVASRIIFHVFHQAEGGIAASKTFPLSTSSSFSQTVAASSKPTAPRIVSESNNKIDTDLDVNFVFASDNKMNFQIKNNSSFPVKINTLSAKAKFLIGIDQDVDEISCKSREIPSGQSVDCKYHFQTDCPALSEIVIEAAFNGNIRNEKVKFAAPIKRITEEPIISLEKYKKIPQYDASGGTAKIIIRGLHVKIGGRVTMKALASVDSDRFPVVFDGVQRDDGIHAEVTVRGTDSGKKPDKFCFNLMEITTCDQTRCGGVGVLLYRNEYTYDIYPDVNLFLHKKECK